MTAFLTTAATASRPGVIVTLSDLDVIRVLDEGRLVHCDAFISLSAPLREDGVSTVHKGTVTFRHDGEFCSGLRIGSDLDFPPWFQALSSAHQTEVVSAIQGAARGLYSATFG